MLVLGVGFSHLTHQRLRYRSTGGYALQLRHFPWRGLREVIALDRETTGVPGNCVGSRLEPSQIDPLVELQLPESPLHGSCFCWNILPTRSALGRSVFLWGSLRRNILRGSVLRESTLGWSSLRRIIFCLNILCGHNRCGRLPRFRGRGER